MDSDKYKNEVSELLLKTSQITSSIPLVTIVWKDGSKENSVTIYGAESEEDIDFKIQSILPKSN